ncbi:DNA polymerase I [Lichenihabitans sp. Uapishka_5]|uniref:DNA polymerase I n=1 Tax=Lichenihabitans sp. Uapishka_5 TaxID=3037302 RepID=UPI0029E7F84B|nr:DNA polymerase I [Lichenihabitans sp. Uapishka_5]MDX7953380.1 DNA polymerase I [Lichenihabitans sp. Uapishka_5]
MTPTPTHRPVKPGDHVFLVDGSGFIFRAYFQSIRQDAKYNYRSDALPTGAVRLFATKLFQFIREGAAGFKPTHLAIIFDKSENSFRKDLYPAYKGHRSEPPEDLLPQFPLMRHTVRAFGLEPVEQDTYEADDLIATYAREARAAGADVLIISADKDLMQLIEPGVIMYDPASGDPSKAGSRGERIIGEQEVVDYFGVRPDRVVDVQALAGDSTDNVPGAPGIGLKTAAQLITDYGDLETLLARAGEIKQPKRRETLTDPEKVGLIRTSKTLVTLVRDVKLTTPLERLGLHEPDPAKLVPFLKAMEFTTLTKRAAEAYRCDAADFAADPDYVGTGGWRSRNGHNTDGDFPVTEPSEAPAEGSHPVEDEATPGAAAAVPAPALTGPQRLAAERVRQGQATVISHKDYTTITTLEALDAVLAEAAMTGVLAVDTETTSLDARNAAIVGIALATAPGAACYIPIGHLSNEAEGGLFGEGALLPDQLPLDIVLARLKPVLEGRGILKVAQNMKYDWLVFKTHGVEVQGFDDTMLLSYALDAGMNSLDFNRLDALSKQHLNHTPIAFKDLTGSGKSFIGFARVPIDKATEYAAEDADVAMRLWLIFKARLPAEGVTTVYEELERPMVETLARMERRGIQIDPIILRRLSGEFAAEQARLEAKVYVVAGETFNLGSTKQVADILFGKMGLPGARKTPTGAWSTRAQILDDLAEQGNPFARLILEWRQVSKLRATYTDALPGFIDPKTDRVHTSFALAATTTGRLSSSDPNIQNIPIRTEAGRKIRKAFVAAPGHKLISADYGQIELRLLAHMADIPELKAAFAEGRDIHASTASEMFNVPIEGMPSETRRRAKAINFGIVYGISAFGLANQLGIPREEAGAYIRTYFDRFPGIRTYMDATKRICKQQGYVETLFGRKCHYPRITASNPAERAFNERAAVNAPIQGTAADIIRRAMIRMDDELLRAKLSARMLLQVHDELVFEVPDAEVEATIPVITRVMIEAPYPAITLDVPLVVEARAAENWDEAH